MKLPDKYHYMGPLSRFNASSHLPLLTHLPVPYRCLILSGPEPQRSLFRDLVISSTFDKHLVILSSTGETGSASSLKSITVVTNPDTEMMRGFIAASEMVICRSGYTSLMELMSLGKDAVIIPTPGQTEQEYLGKYLNARSFTYNNKVFVFQTLMQGDVAKIRELKTENTSENNCFPDAQSLFREALIMLSEKKKE